MRALPGARAARPARPVGAIRAGLPRIRGRGEQAPGQPVAEQRPVVVRRSRPAAVERRPVVVRRSRLVRRPPGWRRAPAAPAAGAGPHWRERCPGPVPAGIPEVLRGPPAPVRQPPNVRRYPRPPPAPTVRRRACSAHRRCHVAPAPRAVRDVRRARPCRRGSTALRAASRPRCSWRQRGSRAPRRPPPVPSRPTGPGLVGQLRRSTRVPALAGRSPGLPAWAGWVPAGAPARWPGRRGVAAAPRPVRRPGAGPRPARVGRRARAPAAAPPRPGPTAPERLPGSVPAVERCPTRGPVVSRLPRQARPGSGVRGAEEPNPDLAARRHTRCPASPAGRRMASVRQRPATPLPAAGRGGACLRTSCVRLLHQLRPRTPVRGIATGIAGPRAPVAHRTVSGPPEGRFRERRTATPCCRAVSIGFDPEPPCHIGGRRPDTTVPGGG